MMIWYPGCQGGHALANVLFGASSPGGRLPVAFPAEMKQLMDWDIAALDLTHDLLHGYRYLAQHNQQPQFGFGFGLGYSSFDLDGLQVERDENLFRITVTVTNTGQRREAEIVQVYVEVQNSRVFRVPLELKAFGRIELDPGGSCDLEMEISDSDLCFFDQDSNDWELERCHYLLHVGKSSVDLPLVSEWQLNDDGWEPV